MNTKRRIHDGIVGAVIAAGVGLLHPPVPPMASTSQMQSCNPFDRKHPIHRESHLHKGE